MISTAATPTAATATPTAGTAGQGRAGRALDPGFPGSRAGGLLLRLKVGLRLHPGGRGVLLRDQQAANLQELVRLVGGELVGEADGLHLPGRTLRGRLEPFELASVGGKVALLLLQTLEKRVVRLLLALARQAAVLLHRGALGVRAPGGREARRAAVVAHVLELAQVGVETAELVPVVVQRVDGVHQPVDRGLRLIPDVGRRGHRVLQHVLVLLQLGLVLLDLLERLRHRLDGRHHVLREIARVDDGNAGLRRGDDDAAGQGSGERGFSR